MLTIGFKMTAGKRNGHEITLEEQTIVKPQGRRFMVRNKDRAYDILPEVMPLIPLNKQKELFEIYQNTPTTKDVMVVDDDVLHSVKNNMSLIIDLIKDEVNLFSRNYNWEYIESSSTSLYNVHTTYTTENFLDLMSLSIMYKFLIPIVDNWYFQLRNSSLDDRGATDVFKAYPNDFPAFDRLIDYISHQEDIPSIIEGKKPLPRNIVMAGWQIEDVVDMIASNMLTKKIAVSHKETSLIGTIHQAVGQKYQEFIRAGNGNREIGIREVNKVEQEGNGSTAESFSGSTTESITEISAYNHWGDIESITMKIFGMKYYSELKNKGVDIINKIATRLDIIKGKSLMHMSKVTPLSVAIMNIYPNNALLYLNESKINLILATVIELGYSLGLDGIAELLESNRSVRESTVVDSRLSSLRTKQISDESVKLLKEIYNISLIDDQYEQVTKEINEWVTKHICRGWVCSQGSEWMPPIDFKEQYIKLIHFCFMR